MSVYDRMTVIVLIAMMSLLVGSLLSGCSITGRTSTILEEELLGCSLNTDMEFLEINDHVQACYRSNSIYFVVDNTGIDMITGLSVSIEADYRLTMLVKTLIRPGETSQHSLNFGNQELVGVKSLEIYPMVGSVDRRICKVAGISTEIKKC